jgi:hypothetical protein
MPYVSTEEIRTIKQIILKAPDPLNKLIEYYKLYRTHFVQKKQIDAFEFELLYKTHFSLAVNNLDSLIYGNKKDLLKSEIAQFDKLHYFTFQISNKTLHSELLKYNISSEQEYTDRILYYTDNCQKDFILIEDGDTLRSPFVNFERTFDVAPIINMTVVFERKKAENFKHLTFIYEDKIFNSGKIKFQLEPEIISVFNNPEIKKYNL